MLLLSHTLKHEIPIYAGGERPSIRKVRDLAAGDSCNKLQLSFTNHDGTHVDVPSHFARHGKTVCDYPANFWSMTQVALLTLPAVPTAGTLIGPELLEQVAPDSSIEALLLKTGFGRFRDNKEYWEKAPGFRPELAEALRRHFPKIKFFGFDLLSLTSFAHRELGRTAHRAFLDHAHPILLIEDMNLASLDRQLSRLLVSPLFIEEADGAPCTVWGEIG